MKSHIAEAHFVYHLEIAHPFTATEIRIIHLSLCGYNVKEMADRFHVQEDTIYKHRHHIVEKLPVYTFDGALGWVVQHGIFSSMRNQPDKTSVTTPTRFSI